MCFEFPSSRGTCFNTDIHPHNVDRDAQVREDPVFVCYSDEGPLRGFYVEAGLPYSIDCPSNGHFEKVDQILELPLVSMVDCEFCQIRRIELAEQHEEEELDQQSEVANLGAQFENLGIGISSSARQSHWRLAQDANDSLSSDDASAIRHDQAWVANERRKAFFYAAKNVKDYGGIPLHVVLEERAREHPDDASAGWQEDHEPGDEDLFDNYYPDQPPPYGLYRDGGSFDIPAKQLAQCDGIDEITDVVGRWQSLSRKRPQPAYDEYFDSTDPPRAMSHYSSNRSAPSHFGPELSRNLAIARHPKSEPYVDKHGMPATGGDWLEDEWPEWTSPFTYDKI